MLRKKSPTAKIPSVVDYDNGLNALGLCGQYYVEGYTGTKTLPDKLSRSKTECWISFSREGCTISLESLGVMPESRSNFPSFYKQPA